jgi:hypothetical protein
MNFACPRCGSALNPETGQCPKCVAGGEPPAAPKDKRRTGLWLLALLLVFVLGFLLGHMLAPKCPKCPAPSTPGAGGAGGSGNGHGAANGAPGKGTPDKGGGGADGGGDGRVVGAGGNVQGSGGSAKVGAGKGDGDLQGGGTGGGSGVTVGHGNDGAAAGSDGSDDGGGGGGGKSKVADIPHTPDADPDAKLMESGVWKLATGAPLSDGGLNTPEQNPGSASVKVLSAPDFRYDKTGLPRYPDANTAVFSALSYAAEGSTDRYGSSSGIATSSSFDTVVAWYRKSLPVGWSNTNIGDLDQIGALARQLSPDKILQMSTAAGQAQPVDNAPATDADKRTRISMFSPPERTKGDLGVMIVQKGDKPVQIFMKTHVQPQAAP